MIKKVIKYVKKVFIPKSEFEEETTTKKVDTTPKVQPSYLGVPAPVVAPYDPWFGDAPKTEKAMEYVQKKNDELYRKLAEPKLKEPEDIHQKMYEMATQNWTTVSETQGGSENFQEGPGGWNSGTGLRQFK